MNPNISKLLQKRVDEQKQAVGLVVGVIDPTGRRVVAHGNLAKDDPRTLDGDTIFEIGSISKVFTSLLLADMVNRKEVALDDPAGKYLPGHVKMPERNGKPITLLHLSTHRSGLPPVPSNLKPKDLRNPYADYTVDALYEFLSGYTLPRDPGSEFEYSNLGGGLLGHLLANRAGIDYETLVRTRITEPLEMPDTCLVLSSDQQQRMSTGHTGMLAPTPNWDPSILAGAGGLRSSANDMLSFLEAFLGYKDSPLAPAMKAMLETRPALGWFSKSDHEEEVIWHDGGTGGFRSLAAFDPKQRTGVIVLSNSSGIAVDIGFHLLNPNSPLANPEPPPQRTEVAIDPALLDNYLGRYQVTPALTLEITRDGSCLFAQSFATMNGAPVALPKFELFPESEAKFFAKVADHQVTFEPGPDGKATSLVLLRRGAASRTARQP